ncbi:tetratricopeptide repeat protein [bacterium]|nr:tetratricopeptide repeat protein [bacterium]
MSRKSKNRFKGSKVFITSALIASALFCPFFQSEGQAQEPDSRKPKAVKRKNVKTFDTLSRQPINGDTILAIVNDTDNMIAWRKFAENLLKKDKNSPEGNAVIGMVYYCAEGDLPRARHHLEKATKEALKRARRGDSRMGSLYLGSQLELLHILGEMDDYAEKIKQVDNFTKYAGDFLEVEKAWPLMKLGREDEARKVIDKAAKSGNFEIRCAALNTLGALECDLGHYQSAYNTYDSLISEVIAHHVDPEPTFWRNLGEEALCLGRYDEAEKCFIDAAHATFSDIIYSNPYSDLAGLYIEEARFTDAASTLKKTLEWSRSLRPFLYQQHMAEDTQLTAVLMLELGYIPEAVKKQKSLIGRPDRQGGSSIAKDQAESGNLLTWYAILHAQRENMREELSWSQSWTRKLKIRMNLAFINYTMWRTAGRIRALLAENERIVPSFRPFNPKGIQVSENYRHFMVDILGPGTCAAALDELNKRAIENYPVEEPYIILHKAEIAYAMGNKKAAYKNFLKAKETLPKAAALVKAQAEVRSAQLAKKYGGDNGTGLLNSYAAVLKSTPMVFRHTETSIPVKITSSAPAISKKFENMIDDSPRFDCKSSGEPAFDLRLSMTNNKLTASLSNAGTVISTSQVNLSEDTDQTLANLVKEVHNQTFSTKISLNSLGLDSLDGSNLSGSTARDQFDEMLDTKTAATSPVYSSSKQRFESRRAALPVIPSAAKNLNCSAPSPRLKMINMLGKRKDCRFIEAVEPLFTYT